MIGELKLERMGTMTILYQGFQEEACRVCGKLTKLRVELPVPAGEPELSPVCANHYDMATTVIKDIPSLGGATASKAEETI